MAAILNLTTGIVYVRSWAGTLNGAALALTDVATITKAGIGVTTTAGLTLQNLTDAANGAQQYSPGLSFIGQGWKTNATAASQPVEVRWELRPVQGAAAPTYNYVLMGRVNGGAWADLLTYNSATGLLSASHVSVAADFSLKWPGRMKMRSTSATAWQVETGGEDASLRVAVSVSGGASLTAHPISLAQDATTKVGTAPVGILTVTNTTDASVAQFSLIGTGVVVELSDSSGNYSATKDNAATINVYYSVDGVYVQNKIAATKSVRLVLTGV